MNKRWQPKNGEWYYYIQASGAIAHTICSASDFDHNLWLNGNCFVTIEDAIFERKCHETERLMFDWADKHKEIGLPVYELVYVPANDAVIVDKVIHVRPGIKFTNPQTAYNVIEYFGEKWLKKYYFRIEQEE